ncbi:hypothetical protein [Plantactinospora endophytica]|uniref:4Fe-4S Wbl-type domain-containing protein n=1 Tax=Plantactinospora endophytica TaxID=673535 RepID=A0ABQ4DXE0_9ACTN|nr:hypothetical protein [Plantactinospora endophytica]GIG87132.1 hypothetical protein Pen02_20680 [Plantactinospora endophytica]
MVTIPELLATDQRIFEAHTNGGRCDECAPRGGCMALLGAVRRRTDQEWLRSHAAAILMNATWPSPDGTP